MFEFCSVLEGIVGSPLRWDARVHHQGVQVDAVVCERTKAQPVNQFATIVLREDFRQRCVVASGLLNVIGQCDEVQIVIAEYCNCSLTKTAYKAQGLARLRASIDEITGNPQPILLRIENNFVEQAPKRIVATLQIAYRVLGQLMKDAGNGEGKGWNWRLEMCSVVGFHAIAALHRTDRCLQYGTA